MAKGKTATVRAAGSLGAFDATLDKALALAVKDPDAFEGAHERQGNPITLGPAVPEAADWSAKMVERAGAAGPAWLKGVKSPKKNPLVAAKAANARYKAQVQKALTEDKWVKAIDQVDEEMMYKMIDAAGESAFTQGVTRRAPKVTAAIEKLRPLVLALRQTIDAMPNVTDADREARMIASRRGMIKIGKTLRGVTT